MKPDLSVIVSPEFPPSVSGHKQAFITLELTKVILDERLNIRNNRSAKVIRDYAENYRELDKGSVMLIDGKYHLIDGWYRFKGAQRFGIFNDDFEDLGKGNFKDALKAAFLANKRHGIPLTRADRVKVAQMIEASYSGDPKWTRRDTANLMGIKHNRLSELLIYPDGMLNGRTGKLKQDKIRSHPIDRELHTLRSSFQMAEKHLTNLTKRYRLGVWSAEQKQKLAIMLKPFKSTWEKL